MSLGDYANEVVEISKKRIKNKVKKTLLPFVLTALPVVLVFTLLFIVIIGITGGNAQAQESLYDASDSGWEQFKSMLILNEGGTKVNAVGKFDINDEENLKVSTSKWTSYKSQNKNNNGAYYIVENDGANCPTVGHGICLKSGSNYLNTELFSSVNINSKYLADNWLNNNYTELIECSIVDSIFESIVQDKLSAVENYLNNNNITNLTEYQKYALVDVMMYRRGNINGFAEAYNSKWIQTDTEKYYGDDVSQEDYSNETLYSFFYGSGSNLEGVLTRKKNQWLLFKYGYYNQLKDYWRSASIIKSAEGAEGFISNSGVYNDDGSVNENKIFNLAHTIENAYGIVRSNGLGQWKKFSKYDKTICENVQGQWFGFNKWKNNKPRTEEHLLIYQCVWWAQARACSYMGKNIIVSGNGKDIAKNMINAGYGETSTVPVANSIVSYKGSDEYGHVAYIEAVDTVNQCYYISQAGSGSSWGGIAKISYANGLNNSKCGTKTFCGICVLNNNS